MDSKTSTLCPQGKKPTFRDRLRLRFRQRTDQGILDISAHEGQWKKLYLKHGADTLLTAFGNWLDGCSDYAFDPANPRHIHSASKVFFSCVEDYIADARLKGSCPRLWCEGFGWFVRLSYFGPSGSYMTAATMQTPPSAFHTRRYAAVKSWCFPVWVSSNET